MSWGSQLCMGSTYPLLKPSRRLAKEALGESSTAGSGMRRVASALCALLGGSVGQQQKREISVSFLRAKTWL